VQQLLCPEGCSFRTRTSGLRGWSRPSRASTPVVTAALPPLPPGAARLQLRLLRIRDGGGGAAATRWAADLAARLGVPAAQVRIGLRVGLALGIELRLRLGSASG